MTNAPLSGVPPLSPLHGVHLMGGRRRRDAGEASVQQTKDTNKNLTIQAHDCTMYTPAVVLCFGAPVTKRDRSPMAVHTRMRIIEADGWKEGGHW